MSAPGTCPLCGHTAIEADTDMFNGKYYSCANWGEGENCDFARYQFPEKTWRTLQRLRRGFDAGLGLRNHCTKSTTLPLVHLVSDEDVELYDEMLLEGDDATLP